MPLTGQDRPAYSLPFTHDEATVRILTLAEVCQYLGIPRRTLYRMIDDGRFAVRPMPGMSPRRWRVEDVDAWRNATIERA